MNENTELDYLFEQTYKKSHNLQEGGKRKNMPQETIDRFIHQLLLVPIDAMDTKDPSKTRRQAIVDEIFNAIKDRNSEAYYKDHPEMRPSETNVETVNT